MRSGTDYGREGREERRRNRAGRGGGGVHVLFISAHNRPELLVISGALYQRRFFL